MLQAATKKEQAKWKKANAKLKNNRKSPAIQESSESEGKASDKSETKKNTEKNRTFTPREHLETKRDADDAISLSSSSSSDGNKSSSSAESSEWKNGRRDSYMLENKNTNYSKNKKCRKQSD